MKYVGYLLLTAGFAFGADDAAKTIPAGSKVYVQPMDGFGNFVTAAINKKKVAIVIVADRDKADYEIGGGADSQKAGWAKIIWTGSSQSREEASITVTNLKSSEVVFAYNVNKGNAARGKQSAAEACAKHLKDVVGK